LFVWKKKSDIKALAAGIALAVAWIGCGAVWAGEPSWVVPGPGEAYQGGIVELRVPRAGLASVEGTFGGDRVFFQEVDGADFTALLGIDLEAKPGPASVNLETLTVDGIRRPGRIALKVVMRAFPQESFTVPAVFDQFGPAVLERIRVEREQFARAFAEPAPRRLWGAPFVAPLPVEISSPFGYRRVINGKPRAPHTGVDLRAPTGTEVSAANDGRVVLVGDFFFNGKSVVLDHGAGIYTMYFHLSEIKVEHGAAVRKGDVIALSGMSGRVTGPHLHWGARLNGARVDPLELVPKGAPTAESAEARRFDALAERQNGN
jgi:hypothetical protein